MRHRHGQPSAAPLELHHPLRDRQHLRRRLAAIRALIEAPDTARKLRELLRGISDLERIAARIALRSARPRDLSGLRDSLARLPELRASLGGVAEGLNAWLPRLAFPAAPGDELGARDQAGAGRRAA